MLLHVRQAVRGLLGTPRRVETAMASGHRTRWAPTVACVGAVVLAAAGATSRGTRGAPTVDPVPAPSLADTLVSLERASWRAWQERDTAFFRSFLSDDHVEVGASGVTGKAGVLSSVAASACVVRSYAVGRFQMTRLDSATTLLTYHAAQETTCAGHPVPSPAWAASLYMLRDGRWMNVVYQQSATR